MLRVDWDSFIYFYKDPFVIFLLFATVGIFFLIRAFMHEFWCTELDGKKPPF